jgi:hypothetical protein
MVDLPALLHHFQKPKVQKLHFISMHNHHSISQLVTFKTVDVAAILEDYDLALYYKAFYL